MLTEEQLSTFKEEGYIVVGRLISDSLVREARGAINYYLGEFGLQPGGQYPRTLVEGIFNYKDCTIPEILALHTRSKLTVLAGQLLRDNQVKPITHGQIALRFPRRPLAERIKSSAPHVDGMSNKYSKNPNKGYAHEFQLLENVLLSDMPKEDMGNLTVWPKSHQLMASYLRRQGKDSLRDELPPEVLREGPVKIKAYAGDVILAHHLLVHAGGFNGSTEIRYAVIFRVALHSNPPV